MLHDFQFVVVHFRKVATSNLHFQTIISCNISEYAPGFVKFCGVLTKKRVFSNSKTKNPGSAWPLISIFSMQPRIVLFGFYPWLCDVV